MMNQTAQDQRLDRAYGCLIAGAIGDAMGMPASFFTREQIKRNYGYIQDFLVPAEEQHAHGSLEAGEVTDDTMESLIIARLLAGRDRFPKEEFLTAMRDWAIKEKMLETTLIGPSTRRFLEAVIKGEDPAEGAKTSLTNGSIMRVAPVGIKFWNDMDKCMEEAAASSVCSHGSAPCVAGACAAACAVAAGIHGGYTPGEVMDFAIAGAKYGEAHGHEIPAPSVSKRIQLAREIVDRNAGKSVPEILDELVGIIGAGMTAFESAPFSLGVFYACGGNAREGILAAINAGDDADTNGSIAGNLCGAYSGAAALPQEWIVRVERVSGIDTLTMARELLA